MSDCNDKTNNEMHKDMFSVCFCNTKSLFNDCQLTNCHKSPQTMYVRT